MEAKPFSPRQFLRARRPERFSDSIMEEERVLDRSMLEYHLDSLTSRGQETNFERFARRLAQKEICPNLLPQTGPTGGGDSKVDAETYPVADDLALIWYVGTGREAASERWAFAFSAKRKWRPKVQSDIQKIAATNRGYSKAFFVTNQYVPDRTRGEVEDRLREDHGMDVRILDRSWILDRVFEGAHEDLAIAELGLETSARTQVRKGPLDLRREDELAEIEARISAVSEQGRFGLQFVSDCIEAATLARSLDRPRTDVEGLFSRAQRVAEKHGTPHQCLVIAYQAAWTAFWWYEDDDSLARLYGAAEQQAQGTQNAYDLELLTNLWMVLRSSARQGRIDEADAKLEARTNTLMAELERLSKQQDRPSTALQARTLRLQMQLLSSLPGEVDDVLREMQGVVRECEGLVGYPFEPLAEMLAELGQFLGDRPAYGELFETVVAITSERKGEVSAARMLLRRGAQQLDADRPYEAIKSLGRALVRLYKHESRETLVHALYLCGGAYEHVGLLWAARGTLLAAASVATSEFWTYSEVTPLQAACYSRLKWLELRLGRLPQTLAWHEVDSIVRGVLADQGYNPERLARGEIEFGAILGMLLLRTDIWELKWLSFLPDVLDTLGLQNSAVALRFALGHEDQVPDALVGERADRDALYRFFAQWRDQPAAEDLPTAPLLYEQRVVTLSSHLLGCHIIVSSENTTPCVELAEWVLAAIESLLSTGMLERIVAREPVLTIKFRKSDFAEAPFDFKMQDCEGRPHMEVQCPSLDTQSMSQKSQGQLKDRMLELLSHLLARVFTLGDPEETLVKLFRDELALDRSIQFTSSFVTLGNVLGPNPKTTISAWSNPDVSDYPLTRSEEWDAADRREKSESGDEKDRLKPTLGTGEPPPEVSDMGRAKHTEIETVSLIRERLWNEAEWFGMVFLWDPAPPRLAPLFRCAKAAAQIFGQWRKELGPRDEEERLRVTIIRGVDQQNPYTYRVIIGVNPETAFAESAAKYVIMVSRMHTMTPASDRSLRGFLDSYAAHGRYFLAYAVGDTGSSVTPVLDSCIEKRELNVREAWEIGRHDVDAVGILEDDDPIIPPDQEHAPLIELLRWRQNEKFRGQDT